MYMYKQGTLVLLIQIHVYYREGAILCSYDTCDSLCMCVADLVDSPG